MISFLKAKKEINVVKKIESAVENKAFARATALKLPKLLDFSYFCV
jgi:hypothetical protein